MVGLISGFIRSCCLGLGFLLFCSGFRQELSCTPDTQIGTGVPVLLGCFFNFVSFLRVGHSHLYPSCLLTDVRAFLPKPLSPFPVWNGILAGPQSSSCRYRML